MQDAAVGRDAAQRVPEGQEAFRDRAAVAPAATAGPPARILLVEPDSALRDAVSRPLRERGDRVLAVGTGREALSALGTARFDVVLLGLELPDLRGLSVLEAAASLQPEGQFVVVSSAGSVPDTVEAMRRGAFDYRTKPCAAERLLEAIEDALEDARLRARAAALSGASSGARAHMVGRSPAMERLFDLIERVAPMRANVLVTGETGTGKELVARAIHDLSGRARRPFVPVNCSALPSTLLESELFGHVRGSFTGAVAGRRGVIEEAAGGTLFLDEVSTLTPETQVKLLRVLEERVIHRVGSSQPVPVDFRLIAATNENLAARVEDGSFREDLYYRLEVFPIRVPALRERPSDIPLLAAHFRSRYARDDTAPRFSDITLRRMMAYAWPGNVRELENFVERTLILYANAPEIRFDPSTGGPGYDVVRRATSEQWDLARLETEYILAVLERTDGHRARAADILGIDRRTLYRKLRALPGSARN